MVKSYIPFTKARRQRLYAKSLQKQLGGAEVLLQIEYPDSTEQLKPANWNPAINAWQTADGQRWYSTGRGGDPGILNGVPIVHVDAQNAGVVSKEAAKFANREEEYDYVDSEGNPVEVTEVDDDGTPLSYAYPGEDGEQGIAADGGEIDLHYDLSAPEGYAGEVIDRRKAGLFDPFPVSRQEADQAIEHAKAAANDSDAALKYAAAGAIGVVAILAFFYVLMWLLGQIGGSGGGGGGQTVSAMVGMFEVYR